MIAKTFGLQALTVASAALFLAACASTNPADDEATARAAADAAAQSQPQAVPAPVVEEEQIIDPFGDATQSSLENYAGDRVFFAFDSSELSPTARQTLQRQAEWLQKHRSVKATVEGHADERGTREYNLALGERRAAAAKNYLVALGIAPDRLDTISYGKERPAVLGSGENVWRQNRRSVLTVGRSGA
ncbi:MULTISPECIES: peptidoglycan-associated lipoprotein Pal [unclassified Iodidimonas]|jgi:peptidoglycan-associated lipoprotein|uniref:peptidoglycan-associated lipoprotein Pal n=1 Tax=unclassified Iodidimonas TaxID=2626145 RepID=UPI002482D47F|nr:MULTISPECIES: peptidoglycan-associated lipoprotein Pal [unclassified Iodidimonas]